MGSPEIKNVTVWPTCKLQVIDERTMRWRTIAECLDTPNVIDAKLAELNRPNVWVLHAWGDRELR